MITGDNPLTACHVAKELHFTRKSLLVLTAPTDGIFNFLCLLIKLFFFFDAELNEWKWESVNKDINLPIQPANIRNLTREYDLCVTGEVNFTTKIIFILIFSLFFRV